MKTSGIYKIVNKVNGKYYVGSSNDILTPNQGRKYLHYWALKRNRHSNRKLQFAWNKYGEENFDFLVVEECSPERTLLLDVEQKYLDIAKNEQDKTYNLSFIAGGIEMTEETRRLIGISKIGNKYCLGKRCSEKTKEKISKANTGKKRSSEACERISKSRIGKYTGENSPFFGRKLLESTREKISKKCKGLFIGTKSYKYDYTIYTFRNIKSDEIFVGTRHDFYTKFPYVSKSNLGSVIEGTTNRKTVNGWEVLNRQPTVNA